MEHEPERLPERRLPPRPPNPQDLARLAESRRALDQRSEAPGAGAGDAGQGMPGAADHPGQGPYPGGAGMGGQPGMPGWQGQPGQGPYPGAGGNPGDAGGGANPSGQLVRAAQPGPPAERPGPPRPGDRLPVPARQRPPKPMSDLTTTMPILVIPAEDTDIRPAPPGAPGHFHIDDGSGRHRGGSRMPRGLLVTFGVAVAAGVGLVVSGAFDGGSSSPGSAVARAGASSAPGGPTTPGDPAPSSGVAQGPDDGASSSPSGASPTPTPSRSRTPGKARPTTVAPTPAGSENVTQPGSPGRSPTAPSRTTASPTSNPASTTPAPSPSSTAFQPLSRGMTGPAVSEMQHLLEQDRYLWWYTDGTFDQNTLDAVRLFQSDNPGTAAADGRGVYGAATRAALLADLGLGP